MLKQRLITALILVPAVVALVLLAPTPTLALLLGLVVLIGAQEWARLSGFASPVGRSLFLVALTLLMVAAEWLRREGLSAPIF
ncbi:MAG: phosphatidate cytidylyltransferase, partial [Gammaproteobacteria bacterium SHHR-1]